MRETGRTDAGARREVYVKRAGRVGVWRRRNRRRRNWERFVSASYRSRAVRTEVLYCTVLHEGYDFIAGEARETQMVVQKLYIDKKNSLNCQRFVTRGLMCCGIKF